ncbi:hypothetical protein WJX84_004110 [Apatococcus fuscideae]|uniref:Nudix hydrolase domain-containing protein n=1 Tax=Apatococcus fuscideae TaxID=2026836 RepID=A0AAW1SSF2_9CHLO
MFAFAHILGQQSHPKLPLRRRSTDRDRIHLAKRCPRHRRRLSRISAAIGPAPEAPGGGQNWEPWKKKSNDDAARKALQDMFSGQKDVLAAYDPGEAVTTGGGGSRGKGGGGGFSWRPKWQEWGDGFWRSARGAGQVLGAFMLLCGVFAAAALREPALKGIVHVVRWVLRLEGSSTSGRRRIRGENAPEVVGLHVADRDDLGVHEKYVLAKKRLCLRSLAVLTAPPAHTWLTNRRSLDSKRGAHSLVGNTAWRPRAMAKSPLEATEDFYDGIIIFDAKLPKSVEEFSERLDHSLELWANNSKRGIWLRVPHTQAQLIHPAMQRGFGFHHAEPEYLMLTRWLPGSPSTLPANASHQVGIGAFVLNEAKEVLVVQEKSGGLRGTGIWKMPTGVVNQGENVTRGSEREVLEETGLRAKFESILAVRQAHNFAFGKSDMFFVVALRPEDGEQKVVAQESEIEAVRWMPLEEYSQMPFLLGRPILKDILASCMAYARGEYKGMTASELDSGRAGRGSELFISGHQPYHQAGSSL